MYSHTTTQQHNDTAHSGLTKRELGLLCLAGAALATVAALATGYVALAGITGYVAFTLALSAATSNWAS